MQNLIDLVVSYGDLSLHWAHIPFFTDLLTFYTDLKNAHDHKSTNSVNFTFYTSVFVHFFLILFFYSRYTSN